MAWLGRLFRGFNATSDGPASSRTSQNAALRLGKVHVDCQLTNWTVPPFLDAPSPGELVGLFPESQRATNAWEADTVVRVTLKWVCPGMCDDFRVGIIDCEVAVIDRMSKKTRISKRFRGYPPNPRFLSGQLSLTRQSNEFPRSLLNYFLLSLAFRNELAMQREELGPNLGTLQLSPEESGDVLIRRAAMHGVEVGDVSRLSPLASGLFEAKAVSQPEATPIDGFTGIGESEGEAICHAIASALVRSMNSSLFKDDMIDQQRWSVGGLGTGTTVNQRSGRIEIEFAPDASEAPDNQGVFGKWITSTCTLRGDFDVRVRFQLLDWTPLAGVTVAFAAGRPGLPQATHVANRGDPKRGDGEAYFTVVSVGASASVRTNCVEGCLRLCRVGDGVFVDCRDARTGKWLTQHPNFRTMTRDDVRISLWAIGTSRPSSLHFANQSTRIAFSNAHLVKGKLICLDTPTS